MAPNGMLALLGLIKVVLGTRLIANSPRASQRDARASNATYSRSRLGTGAVRTSLFSPIPGGFVAPQVQISQSSVKCAVNVPYEWGMDARMGSTKVGEHRAQMN